MTLRALRASALSCALMTSACTSLYLHDPQLAERTATARTTVEAADMLAPYDQRIGALATLAEAEDRMTLRRRVAERNLFLARLAGERDRTTRIRRQLERDWASLIGAPTSLAEIAPQRAALNSYLIAENDIREARMDGARDLAEYTRRYQDEVRRRGGTPDAIGCETLIALSPDDLGRRLGVDELGAMRAQCIELDAVDDIDPFEGIPAAMRGGELGSAIQTLHEAQARVSQKAVRDTALADIEAELERANRAAASTEAAHAQRLLDELRSDVGEGQALADLFRWSRIESELDRVERALICQAPEASVPAAERTAAKCDDIAGQTTENKTRVILALAMALAELRDANNADIRSGFWLSAARAVISARKEAAKLQVARERALLGAARQRALALLAQADATAYGLHALYLDRAPPPLAGAEAARTCGSEASACAIQAYVEAHDQGSAPASVLAFRTTQADRLLNAQLARLAAQTDAALLRAATGQLDAYGQGGIRWRLIADLALEAGLIGAVAAN